MWIFSRMVAADIWSRMFNELLNIRSCGELPDVMVYRNQLLEVVEKRITVGRLNSYVDQLRRQLLTCSH